MYQCAFSELLQMVYICLLSLTLKIENAQFMEKEMFTTKRIKSDLRGLLNDAPL